MRRAAVLLAVVAGGHVRADDAEAFRDEYEPHWRRLTAHLWQNVKVAGVAEVRTAPPHLDLFRGTLRFEAVSDDSALVWLGRYQPKGLPPPTLNLKFTEPFPPFDQLAVVRPDGVAVYQSAPPGVGWFRLQFHLSPWQGRGGHWQYHAILADLQLTWPLWAADMGRGPNSYFDPLRKTAMLDRATTRYDLLRRHSRHEGTDAVEVANGTWRGAEWTRLSRPDYLVRERRYAPGIVSLEQFGAYRGYTVSYAPAPPGELPFPTAVRGWDHNFNNGTRVPAEEVTFTEYRRYRPTPDELNVEKRFGVRLPPPSSRPPLPPRGTYLEDPRDPKPPPPPAPKPPAEQPPTDKKVRRQTLLRSGLLLAFAIVAGLAAVWWRRRN